jgi:hypothetical protein
LATILIAVLAVTATRGWLAAGLGLGLAASSKQYVPLILAPLWLSLPSSRRWRALAVAVAGVAALLAPFVALNSRGVVLGLWEFQLRQPFRSDALSWPAIVQQLGGPVLPTWLAFLIGFGVLAVATGRGATPARALVAGATAWAAFVAFSKQAFCNYYWLTIGLLCASAAMSSAGGPRVTAADLPHQSNK